MWFLLNWLPNCRGHGSTFVKLALLSHFLLPMVDSLLFVMADFYLSSVCANICCNFTNGYCSLGCLRTGYDKLVLMDEAISTTLPNKTGSDIYGYSSVNPSILAFNVPSDCPLSDGAKFDGGDGVFLRHPDCLFAFLGLTSTQKELG